MSTENLKHKAGFEQWKLEWNNSCIKEKFIKEVAFQSFMILGKESKKVRKYNSNFYEFSLKELPILSFSNSDLFYSQFYYNIKVCTALKSFNKYHTNELQSTCKKQIKSSIRKVNCMF